MAEIKRLLRLRKKIQKNKPSFKRIESWRYKRVHGGWRAAKGIDSQTREKLKSGVKSPNVGYSTPRKVRGLHPSGLVTKHVLHFEDIEGLDPQIHGIIISSKLGIKKRLTLVEQIQAKGFKILNLGIPYSELFQIKEEPKEKKQQAKKKKSSRKKKASTKITSEKVGDKE